MQKHLHIIVTGRVQLVMYRDFTQRNASRRNLTGTVQNLQDGSVEIFVQGEETMLDQFLVKLQRGPVFAEVRNLDVEELPTLKEYDGFKIIF